MQCFAHPQNPAVGVCKACAKGVCASCAIPVTYGIACSESCKDFAERLTQLQIVNLGNSGIYKAQRFIQPAASLLLVAIGAYFSYKYPADALGWMFVILGGGIFIAQVLAGRRKT